MTTEFGQRVLDTQGADPERVEAEIRAAEEPRTVEEAAIQTNRRNQVAAVRSGDAPIETLMVAPPIAQGEPPQALFGQESIDDLFGVTGGEGVTVASSIAANQAHAEGFVTGDHSQFQERKVQFENNVFSQTHSRLRSIQQEQDLLPSRQLEPERLAKMTPTEVFDITLQELDRIRMLHDSVNLFDVALFEAFRAGKGHVPLPEFQRAVRTATPGDLASLRIKRSMQGLAEIRNVANDIAASRDYANYGEMFVEAGLQDMTPFYPLLSRIGLSREFLETLEGKPQSGFSGVWLGSARQKMRDTLVNASATERNEIFQRFSQLSDWLNRNEGLAKYVTNYNILEILESVFTPEVFYGLDSSDTVDVVVGNMETVLEGLFSVMLVAKPIGAVGRATFRTTNNLRTRQVQEATGNADLAAQSDELMLSQDLSLPFDIQPEEAVPTMLAKPSRYADDIDNVPDGTKEVIRQSERIRGESLESTDPLTGVTLNKADRTNVANRVISELDLDDGAHVQGRMNTLERFENDTGFRMRVVVGESANGGWNDIEDIIDEALSIDPNLENVRIMRVGSEGKLEDVFLSPEEFARAATKQEVTPDTAGRIAGGDTQDESFYLVYDRDRFWHAVDKEVLAPETFLDSGLAPRAILAPNARFGDDIYGSFVKSYMGEAQVLKNFELQFKPFHDLSLKDKQFVTSSFEWLEDFGKNHGRNPTMGEVLARYDGITESQLNGLVSIQEGMDTLHELFNRKLYREFQALGYKTARPRNPDLPIFHGDELARGSVPSGSYLDPDTGKMIRMSSRQVDDLYNSGGRVMKLDMSVDAAKEANNKADLIVLRPGTYDIDDLSTTPMVFHPGYSFRFYDDPYFVVKRTSGVAFNGAVRQGAASVTEQAIKTAGTAAEAERFTRRASTRNTARGVDNVEFKVIRSNDLTNTESTLFQKEAMHREGRLFWDARNFDRLPDVNGSRAALEDPVKSLERGIAIAARTLTHEDPLRSLKNAFKNEFGDLVEPELLNRLDLKEVSSRLGQLRKDVTDVKARNRIKQAKEMIDYLRLIEGTESALVPWMREQALNIAAWVGRTTGANTRAAEKYFQTMDPFRTMRTVAFNAFMVFRPARQALLQSGQIGFLAALEPRYVASVQFFKDAYMLRRGITTLRKSGFDDGYSVTRAAKAMDLTSKEYRKLIKEFDRSGLVDLVDVHSFAGGARQSKKLALPVANSRLGTIGYRAKQLPTAIRETMQRVGFNFGERNNLTFTYNLALKRALKRNKYDSLLEMKPKDWDDLRIEASNLSLGMIRPNSFGYQTGAVGVATQFFSFTHKAALALLGKNPAIKGTDSLKILFGTYMIYGANMFGARDFVSEQLTAIGVRDAEIPGIEGATLVDLLSAGLIETIFNSIGDMTTEDWKDIDLGFLAPGIDFNRIWELQLQGMLNQPTQAVFGAFGNIFSKTLQSYHWISQIHEGDPDTPPGDKFLQSASVILSGVFPGYNDAVLSYLGYQHNRWYSNSLEAMPLRPTMNALIARGLFGARTREELGYYRLQNKIWENKENIQNIKRENQLYLTKQINLFRGGELTAEEFGRNIKFITNWMEEFPEGVRLDIIRGSVLEQLDQDRPTIEKQLIEALSDTEFDPRELIGLVDRFTDIPEEQRQQIKQLAEEVWQGRLNVEAEGIERIQQQVEDQ